MNRYFKLIKDKKSRHFVKKKESTILLYKYGILSHKRRDYKNIYYYTFVRKFHLI
jgi:hypothetical protein